MKNLKPDALVSKVTVQPTRYEYSCNKTRKLNGPLNHQGWGGRLEIKSEKGQSERSLVFSQTLGGAASEWREEQGLEGSGCSLSPRLAGHLHCSNLRSLSSRRGLVTPVSWDIRGDSMTSCCREPRVGVWLVPTNPQFLPAECRQLGLCGTHFIVGVPMAPSVFCASLLLVSLVAPSTLCLQNQAVLGCVPSFAWNDRES